MVKGSFTSEKFIECLEILHEKKSQNSFLPYPWQLHVQDSETVGNWFNSLKEKDETFIFIDLLLKYYPEINPGEYFNQEFKGKNSKEVEKSITAYISSYDKNDEETRKHMQRFCMGEGCSYSIIQIIDYLTSEK